MLAPGEMYGSTVLLGMVMFRTEEQLLIELVGGLCSSLFNVFTSKSLGRFILVAELY